MTMTNASGAAELMTPHKQEMSRQGSILQEYDHHQQLMRLQDQVRQQHYDGPATPLHQQPITMSLSRFDSNDGTASLVFCLQDANAAQTTLAPWNSIYIPKQYRVPIPGQRQSSPGECDLALKIFPRLALPGFDSEPYRAQDLMSVPCERCKNKKRDIFQIAGVDPAVPSPQRLFFSTGEIKLLFKICCPSSHHTEADVGYILTFELHHGKHVLLSETFKNAGPGLVPEPIPADLVNSVPLVAPTGVRAIKRKSSPTTTSDVPESEAHTLSRKRSTLMSLNNIVSTGPTPPATEEPPSPIAAVVPHSPMSYQESEDPNAQTRNKSASYEDPASNKSSRSGSAKVEDIPGPSSHSTFATKPARKRQEPLELSELGIGQRASANLHAAYVNGQLKERAKEGLAVPLLETPKKPLSKPKPQHSCPEPDCDKSFSRLFNLRSHMRTHSKARPFVCEDCNFAFSRRHDRDRHAKKHLSEKPYKCIVCDATFVRQDALVRHLRMDGVQNMCMAAMEQRSMQLGEGENNYMLAAKQQAHDEQLQDQRDADEKKAQKQKQQVQQQHAAGIADLLKHSGVVSDSKDRIPKAEFLDIRPNLDKSLDANLLLKSLEPLSMMETPELEPSSFKNQKLESSLLEAALPRPPRQDPEGPMDGKPYAPSSTRRPQYNKPPQSQPPQTQAQTQPQSQPQPPHPPQPQQQQSQPGSEYYGDSYGQGPNGSHGYYTTPSSRSHSRNHSQSSYPSSEYQTPVYRPHASPAPLTYHPTSSKHYRDEPYGYSGDSMTSTHVPTLPFYDDMPPPSHRPTRAFEEPQPYSIIRDVVGDTPGAAHPPQEEAPAAADPDKSIFEAAVGLLRIRSSQW